MPDHDAWIRSVRTSHDRLAAVAAPLGAEKVEQTSYDDEWSIAQVASHLGSQAEIFQLFLDAGLSGSPAPTFEAFGPVWDRWNAKSPQDQVRDSLRAGEEFVARLEGLTEEQRGTFELTAFGTTLDVSGLAGMRLNEHAVHTWDIAVALDPSAPIHADAVPFLLENLPTTAGRTGKASEQGRTLTIRTTDPERAFRLSTGPEISLAVDPDAAGVADLELPAEALVRLVYGRLDPEHTPSGIDAEQLDELRAVFPGF